VPYHCGFIPSFSSDRAVPSWSIPADLADKHLCATEREAKQNNRLIADDLDTQQLRVAVDRSLHRCVLSHYGQVQSRPPLRDSAIQRLHPCLPCRASITTIGHLAPAANDQRD
jgi:hypothetical protein